MYGGPKWTVSPIYEGMLKEEMDAAAARHPDVPYSPVLIDATYAGLMTGAAETPLVIPALNRDGDCLSDLVLPMFGSIAGAESVLLSFDADYGVEVAMAEAPHGTAPSLMGKDLANPMAMLLACGSVLSYAGGSRVRGRGARVARDLRVRPGDGRGRREDLRPRRLGHHVRVHGRGGREGPHQGRDLVFAGRPLADGDDRSRPAVQDRLQGREADFALRRGIRESASGIRSFRRFPSDRPRSLTNTCSPR